MKIIEGGRYVCINPLAPVYGAPCEITRISKLGVDGDIKVTFIAHWTPDLAGWSFTTSTRIFANDFAQIGDGTGAEVKAEKAEAVQA